MLRLCLMRRLLSTTLSFHPSSTHAHETRPWLRPRRLRPERIATHLVGRAGPRSHRFRHALRRLDGLPRRGASAVGGCGRGEFELGLLLCGSANGVCITANKHAGIRAAIAWLAELAGLARQHNNANVLCLPARYLGNEQAQEIVSVFLNTAFEGGRHQLRVSKING